MSVSQPPCSRLRLRPEQEILVCCARTRREPEVEARLRALLQQELDWPFLFTAAEAHALEPLLCYHVKAAFPELVPRVWMDYLEKSLETTARRNLLLAGQLFRILELFASHGIRAIPYKGPVLAALAYGDLARRQFGDLDLAVRHADLARAHALLVAGGYHATVGPDVGPAGSSTRVPGEYYFRLNASPVVVELHTERTLRYFPEPLDLESLSRRLLSVSLGGRQVCTFSIEDSLPILCVHGSKHLWEQLSWICDIAELVQHPRGVDWDQTLAQAQRMGAQRMLLLGLRLANESLGAPLPEEVLRRVQIDRAVGSLAMQICANLFRGQLSAARRFLFRARVHGSGWKGLRYAVRLTTAQT